MEPYDHKKIEKKWQDKWEADQVYKTEDTSSKPKHYVLDMFPYPSGEGLHVGHPKGYIATDIYSRMKRMQGFNVLHPMGWDAFGLPAEEYALKHKVHPREAVEKNIARYKEQLSIIGFDYDWSREVNTTDPAYYKWTQWIFLKLLEKGLAYESHEPINWCPSCQTGLANEDLESGKCERCNSEIEKKPMRQWVLKITDYADRMLKDLDLVNWPESIKISQRNWIGRSEGINFKEKVRGMDIAFEAYDSIPQTFMAQTFAVIAPEHPMVAELVHSTEYEQKILTFVADFKKRKAADKFNVEKEVEGIFTGRFIADPFGTGDLPIWVATFVVLDYGTGFVNCSAHDERDFAFAKKYNIPLRIAMVPEDAARAANVRNLEECYHHDPEGILELPAECKGRKWNEVREDIIKHIEDRGFGKRAVHYKLRDWVFSRQRYWGEPIPVVHCLLCGVVPVSEDDLPLTLPPVEQYQPTGTGESPLANIDEWVNTVCPNCGGAGKRETNTMPQWAGSSWYYLRYIDPKNDTELAAKAKTDYWLPVDMYVGGAEHATRHLIYARFWHKFLVDLGVITTPEPFMQLHNVGMILAEDGRKMSKRWGNVINPDEIVTTYGADSLRLYEMFMGPFENTCAWQTKSILGVRRFLERVWNLRNKVGGGQPTADEERLTHQTIKKVGEDIAAFKFNTAVSAMMIFVNEADKFESIARSTYLTLLQLLAPFAPHIAEELWHELQGLREKQSVHTSSWPSYDATKLASGSHTITVQVNGKVRAQFDTSENLTQSQAEQWAQTLPNIAKWLEGKAVGRTIYIPNKLINIVTLDRP